jgi:hypothetical protein
MMGFTTPVTFNELDDIEHGNQWFYGAVYDFY